MTRKLPDIPPEVARAFLADLKAFYEAGGTGHKADAIAARQMSILREYQRPREKRITVMDVKEMFRRMRQAK